MSLLRKNAEEGVDSWGGGWSWGRALAFADEDRSSVVLNY
jgi:hypothetical protein